MPEKKKESNSFELNDLFVQACKELHCIFMIDETILSSL